MTSGTPRWRIRLSNAAAVDFQGILLWTRTRFGEDQALAYENALTETLELLAEGPTTPGAKARFDIGRGIHALHVSRIRRRARHVVLFRVIDEHRIGIVRILHDSMDLARHLSDQQP
ncbi:type II toxin-antitoxin system RelE/ParE family toxin [Reyranella sp.]|uniref:type II toxin-antitoxin system RelE/ParE family toxin n=1 Tax=Reyranella sp. TaxID=1929291 RepID=UPI00378414CF